MRRLPDTSVARVIPVEQAPPEITLRDIENMTSTEVMAAIDDGRLPEPKHHYRCLDGYYSHRGR